MGAAAREQVSAEQSLDVYCDRLDELYRGFLDQRRATA